MTSSVRPVDFDNLQTMTYEVTDMSRGWFRFHHHHFHISFTGVRNFAPVAPADECLVSSCAPVQHDLHELPELTGVPMSYPLPF